MKKRFAFILLILLSLSKLNAQGDIQVALPIITGSLFSFNQYYDSTSISDINPTICIKKTDFFEDNKIGIYESLAFSKKNTISVFHFFEGETGIKLAVGPVYKFNEKDNYYMVIGSGPQVTFFKDQMYLGVEIDFQTRFSPKKQFSPVVGVCSDINLFNMKIPSRFSSTDDTNNNSDLTAIFYLNVGFQGYIALSINFD